MACSSSLEVSSSSLMLWSSSLLARISSLAVCNSSLATSLLDDYCFCRCCQLLNSKKGCFFALSMAHVSQTILSVDVKEKAIAALISTLKMVHSAPLLIIDATGTSNRLPSASAYEMEFLPQTRKKDVEDTINLPTEARTRRPKAR